MTTGPIRQIVVVGGGLAGWSAAVALKRRVPSLDVTILPLAPAPDALADRIGATLPSILGFHADLGIGEDDAVLRTGSSYRLGSRFVGWSFDAPPYIHAYGQHGRPLPGGSFHLHWARATTQASAPPYDLFSAAAAMASDGRFAPPPDDPADPFAGYEYGLYLDLPRYTAMLHAFARHCGVREQTVPLREVRLRGDGWIDALVLADGSEQRGDLFLDCTGPAAMLRSKIDDRRDDWSQWLPCDRILFATEEATTHPCPLDEVTAWAAGWRWSATTPRSRSTGIVYASAGASDDQAARILETMGTAPADVPVAIAAGNRAEPWRGNCVAIGEAATQVEPLEWTNLHLAHSAIDRLIAMLPDRECATVEAADYNRQTEAEAERVRDFLVLHYAAARRDEPFWRDRAVALLPESLAHTLALFRERGRLPIYEEETFARDSWLAVLFGQGVRPRRIDPLIAATPIAESQALMNRWRQAIAAGVAARPTLSTYLSHQMSQLSR
ncbi:tryptophan halogenase family protein [Sphingomonas sp.]|uniref:tryptophan halogenase family protein n=1 Tax=Sphingomonas sp. TaxID=28214 RepID=UPI0025FAE91F|nr:tryptophan halogenase family protein [Sphingomonas sp.]